MLTDRQRDAYGYPRGINKERIVDFGMFHAALPGKISKEEVIGATLMVFVKEI
jgi:hypothetical protein